jgi:hypothetical protein
MAHGRLTIFKSTVKDAGMKSSREFELTEFEEPTKIRWSERSKNSITVPTGGYDLAPAGDGATQMTIFNEFEGHGFGKVILPLATRAAPRRRTPARSPAASRRRSRPLGRARPCRTPCAGHAGRRR